MSATGYGSLLGNPRLTRRLMDKTNGDASALLRAEFFGVRVAGALAQTLAGGATAASGRTLVQAVSALTSSASTSAVGGLAVRGVAASSIEAVAAAVGALAIQGQVALVAGATVAGTAAIPVVGTLAVTLDDAGVVFVGVVFTPPEPISGAASRRLNRATVSGAGATAPGASILTGQAAIRAASAGVPRRHY